MGRAHRVVWALASFVAACPPFPEDGEYGCTSDQDCAPDERCAGRGVCETRPGAEDGPPSILTFTARPADIELGESSMLSWSVLRAVGIVIRDPGGAEVASGGTAAGNVMISPVTTTAYTLHASDSKGREVLSEPVVVSVNRAPRIRAFTATPGRIEPGGSARLQWSVERADSLQIQVAGLAIESATTAVGSLVVTPTVSTTYTLIAHNVDGDSSAAGGVTVASSAPPEITRLRVTPRTFTGSSTTATITFETTGSATRLVLNGLGPATFPGTPEGEYTFVATGRTDISLFADNSAGTARADLRIERLAVELESGDTAATALALDGDGGGVAGTIEDSGDVDFYSVLVPRSGNIRAEVGDGQGGCAFSSALFLYGPSGTALLGRSDPAGAGVCPELDPRRDAFAADLEPGTYFLAVSSSDGETGRYALLVSVAEPMCGNGVLERGTGEECDDEGLAPADGCSAGCELEPQGALEGPGSSQTFTEAIDAAGEEDWYEVTMTAEGYISAAVYVPIIGRCDNGAGGSSTDALIQLRDSTLAVLGENETNIPGRCASIDPVLHSYARVVVGRYWIRVSEDRDDSTLGPYTIDIRTLVLGCPNGILENGEICDDGNGAAGDGCSPACTVEPSFSFDANAGNTQTFGGSLDFDDEIEWVQINVAEPVYLSAETFVPSSGTCLTGQDTLLVLIDASGVELGRDDNGGIGTCSRIDRAGGAFARLNPGTHFLGVQEDGGDSTIGAYEVALAAATPDVCGDGFVEPLVSEQCDDADTESLDGCSADCQLEVTAAFTLPGPQVVVHDSLGAGAADVFRLDVAGMSYVRAETYAPEAPDCFSANPAITILDSSFAPLGSDDDGGRLVCALLDPENPGHGFMRLEPGAHYLRVEDKRDESIAAYELRITSWEAQLCGNRYFEPALGEECDDGNLTGGDGCSSTCAIDLTIAELEPNDTSSTANDTGRDGLGYSTVSGEISSIGDVDFYRVSVPEGPMLVLRARMYSVPGDPLSSCGDMNATHLRLHGSTGIVVEDDNAGVNQHSCRIDGAATSFDPEARLEPGTYDLSVHHGAGATPIGAYLLELRLEPL